MMVTINSFDKLRDALNGSISDLKQKKTKSNTSVNKKKQETKKQKYEPHPKYPKGVYTTHLKYVLDKKGYVGELQLQQKGENPKEQVVYPSKNGEAVYLSTSESFGKLLEKNKEDILSILDIYQPNHSNNKVIRNANKIAKVIDPILVKILDNLDEKDVQDFVKEVDLSKKMMEEKVYMGTVSTVDKEGLTVCIGSKFGHLVEYEIPYSKLPEHMRDKKFRKGLTVFVDVKRDHDMVNLASRKDFDKPRFDELKNMGIEIGGYKPIFYMTKGGDIFKGKVVGIGNDVFGKQVVFQTNKGKKFPVTLESLKSGMSLANREYHQKKANYRNKKPIKVESKIKKID